MSSRMFSRVRFNVGATISAADHQFQGEVEDLSMAGMFLITGERLAKGEAVDITIALTGRLPEITVSFEGRVSRITENGMAFTFEKIDLDSYMHLKNIVANNSDDAEKVIEDICHSIDAKLSVE